MRHAVHKLICWYLRRCGGDFHCYPYGENGRYAVLMTERQYDRYSSIAKRADPGDDLMEVHRVMRESRDES